MCDDDDLQRYTQQHLREKCGYIYGVNGIPFFFRSCPARLYALHE